MGFLKFLGGKQATGAKKIELPEMPMPPQNAEEETELPGFLEEKTEAEEKLKLPEMPEFEAETPTQTMKNVPQFAQKEDLQLLPPEIQKQEMPRIRPYAQTENELPIEMPEIPVITNEQENETIINAQENEIPQMPDDEPYTHTPAAQPRTQATRLFPQKQREEHALPFRNGMNGQVFVKGETFREIIEAIEEILAKQREKATKEEKKESPRAEERAYEKLTADVEELQRGLIITDKALFESE